VEENLVLWEDVMLDRSLLSKLYDLTEQESFTLTVYVDLDQAKQANRNRGYVVQAEALLKDLMSRHDVEGSLVQAVAMARHALEALEPHAKSALIVCHPARQYEQAFLGDLPFPTTAHWRRGAFLRPLVEALDEHERFAVVLTSRQRARLFTVFMGKIVEHSDFLTDTGHRSKATGTDQFRSDKRQQRHHETKVTMHAKRAIDGLRELSVQTPFDRLVVAGPLEAATQVARLLPRRLRGMLMETIPMSVTASKQEVAKRIRALQERIERQQEETVVAGLLAELHEGGKAVAGIAAVVDAVNRGRVWKLVYPSGFSCSGSECRTCEVFATSDARRCTLCRGTLQQLPHLVDRLDQAVLGSGAQVEVVSGKAAESLGEHGQIAALLRY